MRFGIYLVVFMLTFYSSQLLSQDLKIGFGGGYSFIDNDTYYSGDNSGQLGIRDCYNINLKVKYTKQDLPIIFVSEFNIMSGENDGSYPLMFGENAKFKASQNVYSFSIGIESIIINKSVSPYISFSLGANYFDKTNIEREPKEDNSFRYVDGRIISDQFRFGLDVGIGTNILLTQKFSIDFAFKYSFKNIIGKKDISTDLIGIKLPEQNFYTFNIIGTLLYNFQI